MSTRRQLLASLASAATRSAAQRSFWVFSLFKPEFVRVRAVGPSRVHLINDGEEYALEGDQHRDIKTGSIPHPTLFELEIPGRIRRVYYGTARFDSGRAVITTGIETAVNCVVGAEMPTNGGHLQALAAQAVVSRSFITAAKLPRHQEADFCDTTHCQYFRGPTRIGAHAAAATNGRALYSGNEPAAPLYSAACGGITNGGLHDGLLYTSVACVECRIRKSVRRGHGWGLCQEGAIGLARSGASWQDIVAHYYPNLRLG